MRMIEACSCPAYGGKKFRRQRPAAWGRGIWMMRGRDFACARGEAAARGMVDRFKANRSLTIRAHDLSRIRVGKRAANHCWFVTAMALLFADRRWEESCDWAEDVGNAGDRRTGQ